MRAGTAGSLSPASRSFGSRREARGCARCDPPRRASKSRSRSSERRCSPPRSRSRSPQARSRKRGRRAAELRELAKQYESAMLDAIVAHAQGAVALAEDDARSALASLRHAQRIWLELDAPYEVARTRELIARACSALGDDEAGMLELEAARELFERLGAAPDLARSRPRQARVHGLVGARARGSAARRLREEQPRDRVDARDQRAHRREAPPEHLREARPLVARGSDGLRVRARARVAPSRGQK